MGGYTDPKEKRRIRGMNHLHLKTRCEAGCTSKHTNRHHMEGGGHCYENCQIPEAPLPPTEIKRRNWRVCSILATYVSTLSSALCARVSANLAMAVKRMQPDVSDDAAAAAAAAAAATEAAAAPPEEPQPAAAQPGVGVLLPATTTTTATTTATTTTTTATTTTTTTTYTAAETEQWRSLNGIRSCRRGAG